MSEQITCAVFGFGLLVTCTKYQLLVWDARTGMQLQRLRCLPPEGYEPVPDSQARFLANGNLEADCGRSRRVWQPERGSLLSEMEDTQSESSTKYWRDASKSRSETCHDLDSTDAVKSSDGRWIAGWQGTRTNDEKGNLHSYGFIGVWDAKRCLLVFRGGETEGLRTVLAIANDGDTLVARTSDDSHVEVIHARSGRRVSNALRYGRRAAFASDGTIALQGVDEVLLVDAQGSSPRHVPAGGYDELIQFVSSTPWSGEVLVTKAKRVVEVWNPADGKRLGSYQGLAGANTVTNAAGGRLLVASNDRGDMWTWDLATGEPPVQVGQHHKDAFVPREDWHWSDPQVILSVDGALAAAAYPPTESSDAVLQVYDARTGVLLGTPASGSAARGEALAIDGEYLIQRQALPQDRVVIWKWRTGQLVGTPMNDHCAATISPNGKRAAMLSDDKSLDLVSTDNGEDVIRQAKLAPSRWSCFLDDSVVYVEGGRRLIVVGFGALTELDAETGELVRVFGDDQTYGGALTADGRTVAIWDRARVQRFDVATGHELPTPKASFYVLHAALSNDRRWLLDSGFEPNELELWDLKAQPHARRLGTGSTVPRAVGFLASDKLAFASTEEGVELWDVATGKVLGRLFFFNDGTWAVVDPAGRFDSNRLDRLDGLSWIDPRSPRLTRPIDLLMREAYEPRLLAKLVTGAPLRPIASLSELLGRRTAPTVSIGEVLEPAAHSSTVNVPLTSSGAGNVRLLRNGREIGQWIPTGAESKTFAVQLPPSQRGHDVELSAYAFAPDRTKGATVTKIVRVPCSVATRRDRAYVLTIGVGQNDSPTFSLTFAPRDALLLGTSLKSALDAAGRFEVVPRTLVSTLTETVPKDNRQPTKAEIREAFAKLASEATADDLVIVSFTGHGYAVKGGGFLLLPSNVVPGPDGAPEASSSISADEISDWLRPIDARLVMVIDACQSESAVSSRGFEPGPLAAPGLGQLAYDKSMQILTSTQATTAAEVRAALGHTLLASALAIEGIGNQAAARYGRLTLDAALAYTVQRVGTLSEGKQVPVLFDFRKNREDEIGLFQAAPPSAVAAACASQPKAAP